MLPKQPNQSLIDGLACLQALVAGETGVREMGRSLGLEATRVHRLLGTLAHLGLAERTADKKYRAGPGIHVLAATSLFASGLMRRALPALEKLSETNLIVALGVRWIDQVAYLYHASPGAKPSESIGRTAPFPATQSGLGVALLAGMEENAVRELYRERPIEGFSGITALLDELRATRARGYADVRRAGEERTIGVTVDPQDTPPTVSVGLAGRIADGRVKGLVEKLREAADQIRGKTTVEASGRVCEFFLGSSRGCKPFR